MTGSEPEYGIVVARDVMVPMRDGVRLATDVYRPAVDGQPVAGRFPAILGRTSYDKDSPQMWVEPVGVFFARRGVCGGDSGPARPARVGRYGAVLPYGQSGRGTGRLRYGGVDCGTVLVERAGGHGGEFTRGDRAGGDGAVPAAASDGDVAGCGADQYVRALLPGGGRDGASHVRGSVPARARCTGDPG